MAYVSVTDPTNPTTSPITGIFNMPQNNPVPFGYIGWVSDNDSRIETYLNPAPAPSPSPSPSPSP